MKEPNPPKALVFWIIWFAILNGLFIMLFFAAGGIPRGADVGEIPLPIVTVAAVLAVLSMAIRFLLIPRIGAVEKLLPAMIVGLAFAEGIGIIGMFVVSKDLPQARLALFGTSVSAVLVYAPFFVHPILGRKEMR